MFVFLGGLGLSGCGFKSSAPEGYQVSLEIWGVFDDSDAYANAISAYRKINPYVKDIQYRKLSPETYKEDLINAFASGKGPDIFMIRNSWRAPFEDKPLRLQKYYLQSANIEERCLMSPQLIL